MALYDSIQEAVKYIQGKTDVQPTIGLILGSGLGALATKVENPVSIPYGDIPGFPAPKSLKGHKGELILGTLEGKNVVLMNGRFHVYQGYTAAQIAFPTYVLWGLGVQKLFVTNAAGGLPDKGLSVGNFLLVTDHVNELGTNPLIGYEEDERIGPLFVPMTHCYDIELMKTIRTAAQKQSIPLKEGVYVALHGPSFETRAEIKKLSLYADVVGMSTVPEVIVANQVGLPVAAISCVTNVHGNTVPTHAEVLETGALRAEAFQKLVLEIMRS